MKKYLFSTLFLLGMAVSAIAQSTANRVWYNAYRDKEHKNYATHYIMDRKGMEFHFDWDSDNEMVIKNYKKNGNTETFDTYYKDKPDKKFGSIILTIDGKNPENSKITVTIVEYNSQKECYYIEENNNQQTGSAGDGGKKSVKHSAKNLLNKGKNLFKKKDSQGNGSSAKKSSNASRDDEK